MGQTRTVTFGAVGDIAFCDEPGRYMQSRGAGWLLERVRPVLSQADVLFGNMESVTLPPDYPDEAIYSRGMVTKYDGTPAVAEAGFDFLCLANNHVLDGGTAGMFHTKRLLERRGIAVGGVGRTEAEARRLVTLDKAGLRWGFLCYCEDCNYTFSSRGPGFAYYTREAVLEDIRRARPRVDVLVVSLHADLEFAETPCPERLANGRDFARAGATLVLMHHPHVPQGVERIGRSLVAYSLGNFAFDSHTSHYMKRNGPYTCLSFLLLAEVSRRGVEGFRRVPIRIDEPPDERPRPLAGAEARKALAYFARLDRALTREDLVARNWRQAALLRFRHTLRTIQETPSEDAALHLLAKTLFVAENRSWAIESYRALEEHWRKHHGRVDRLQRPSRPFEEMLKARQQAAKKR